MNRIQSVLSTVVIAASIPFSAIASGEHKGDHAAETKSTASTPMTDGEIKKVDKVNSKITIKHGEIKNLDMPPMTMVFRVKDAAMLDQVKAGDKITFVADKIGGNITVTKIEAAK